MMYFRGFLFGMVAGNFIRGLFIWGTGREFTIGDAWLTAFFSALVVADIMAEWLRKGDARC